MTGHDAMWLVTAASLVGTTANAYRRRWCFAVWVPTNLLWCAYDVWLGAYPQAALMGVYAVLAVVGWRKWKT
jgi:nicotinamide mononucleotide transporter